LTYIATTALLRLGLLPTGYIYPKEERALRDLLRRRLLLVRQRSLHHVSLQSLIARHSGQRLNTLQIKQLTKERLADYLQGHALLGGEITHQARCWLEAAVKRIEQELQRHIKPREDYQLLQTIPGVGSVLGTTIALETGTIERFASPGNYASYARWVKLPLLLTPLTYIPVGNWCASYRSSTMTENPGAQSGHCYRYKMVADIRGPSCHLTGDG